jgi:hypothetical protein
MRSLSTTPGRRRHIKAALKALCLDLRVLHIAPSGPPCQFFPRPPVTFASSVVLHHAVHISLILTA